jgi:iron complex outermembrane receptor protein
MSTCHSAAHVGKHYFLGLILTAIVAGASLPVQAVDTALEEVVVTARKRTESLQDTPLSVSVFSESEIFARAIDSITDLGHASPNVIIDAGASASGSNAASTIFIRGVGQTDFTLSLDPGVGVYVDGVYYGQQVGTALDFLDLERVEILRGPQGTLFGRNTIGGAINILTKQPVSEFGGRLNLTIGSDERIEASGSVNIPLSENLHSKLSIAVRNRDGYVDRVGSDIELGDDDSVSGRGTVLWSPTQDLEVVFSADYTREREEVAPEVLVDVNEAAPIPFFHNFLKGPPCFPPPGSTTDPNCFNDQWVPPDPFTEYGTFDSVSELDLWGLALTATWTFDSLTFRSITAYREFDSFFSIDNDHSPLTIVQFTSDFESEQFTQELQLLGTSLADRLNWLVGLYYYDESAADRNPVDFSIGSLEVGGDLDVTSYAAFAHATYSLTNKLDVTLGIRYTDEEKVRDPNSFFTSPFILGPTLILPPGTYLVPPEPVKIQADASTPLANLTYHWIDELMTYISYSEGFKGGGFTDRVAFPVPETPTFDPEEVESYEVGIKSSFFNNRLRLNVAGFFVDYTNIQILVATAIAPVTQNAAAGEVKGFEIEFQGLLTDNLELSGGLGYIDAEYTRIDPLATEISIENEFPKTPDWSANLSASYELLLPGGGTLTPRLDWSYRDAVFNDALNDPRVRQESFHLLNASLRFANPTEKWGISLSGRNLTDEEYILNGKSNGAQGIVTAIYARPAEWNLSFYVNF